MMKRLKMFSNSIDAFGGGEWSEVEIVAQTVWDRLRKEAGPDDGDLLQQQRIMITQWSKRMEEIRQHVGEAIPPSSSRRY